MIATNDLQEELESLLHRYPTPATDHRADFAAGEVPLPWAVYDPETDDMIGAGDSESEALADAIETVRWWGNA